MCSQIMTIVREIYKPIKILITCIDFGIGQVLIASLYLSFICACSASLYSLKIEYQSCNGLVVVLEAGHALESQKAWPGSQKTLMIGSE